MSKIQKNLDKAVYYTIEREFLGKYSTKELIKRIIKYHMDCQDCTTIKR